MKRKRGSGWYNHPSEHAVCSLGLSPRNTRDRKNIRNAISAELDAISMYEKIAEETDDPRLERLFRHIAREEKHHLSEFGVGLRMKDPEQLEIDPEGIKEALEQIKGKELTEEDKEKIIDAIRQKLAEHDPDKLLAKGRENNVSWDEVKQKIRRYNARYRKKHPHLSWRKSKDGSITIIVESPSGTTPSVAISPQKKEFDSVEEVDEWLEERIESNPYLKKRDIDPDKPIII